MDVIKLRFESERASQTIDLYRYDPEKSIVDTLVHSNYRVYQDQGYQVFLENRPDISFESFSFRINNVEIPARISSSNEIIFEDYQNRKVFEQSYGYMQIQVVLDESICYESSYIPVMVKKGIKNDSVRRMTEFIYQNNAVLLSSATNTPDSGNSRESIGNRTIEAKLVLLKKILGILETNYSYFKINSRYKTEHVERTDYFEKLQYVSVSTIQYIAQHPDELKRTTGNTGIVINGHRYQPERTLITQNQINYDIEENRAILGFVDRLAYDMHELKKQVDVLIQNSEYDSYEDGDYVSSTYYVYVSTMDILLKMRAQIEEFEKRIIALQLAYHTVFNFTSEILKKLPKPSALFIAIPQYKQVFDCMTEWLKRAEVGLQQHSQILGLKKMNEIYELYVLLKILKYFESKGYHLDERSKEVYSFDRRSFYRNTRHVNRFRFVNGIESVTVFYQPVIYSDRHSIAHGIGLYRNTTLPDGGEYYTPDYLLKYESSEHPGAKYVILDAKFSDIRTVKKYKVKDLVFKYLFSVSPIDLKDAINGLCVVNGQSDRVEDYCTDIYNRKLSGTQIEPRAEIITLTENATENSILHTSLFDQCFGRII